MLILHLYEIVFFCFFFLKIIPELMDHCNNLPTGSSFPCFHLIRFLPSTFYRVAAVILKWKPKFLFLFSKIFQWLSIIITWLPTP